MKRVALALFSTVAGLVMLLDYKTHSATSAAASSSIATSAAGDSSGPVPATTTTPSTGSSATASTSTSTGTKTYTGTAVNTRYGPVQVQITVTNGKVSAVKAVDYPQGDPRDQQINSYAIPQLNSEALAAQSAKIDMVSGATYTSSGYTQSLQSALDKAGL